MAISDAPPRPLGSERVAREHDRNAETFERYAELLDRHGAHHAARLERRLADDERRAAATTRRRS
jgi:hypothetical protein